jgi:hypothetical protein
LKIAVARIVALPLALLIAGCAAPPADRDHAVPGAGELAGAWRATIQFQDGAFAPIHDLEFMYVFNAGGTMTESSNYDGAPPVPPAYGIWRKMGPNRFEARYEYYATKAPAAFDELKQGGGWLPAGRGVFTEDIQLSADGKSFTSAIKYEALDPSGKPAPGGGSAAGRGRRMTF